MPAARKGARAAADLDMDGARDEVEDTPGTERALELTARTPLPPRTDLVDADFFLDMPRPPPMPPTPPPAPPTTPPPPPPPPFFFTTPTFSLATAWNGFFPMSIGKYVDGGTAHEHWRVSFLQTNRVGVTTRRATRFLAEMAAVRGVIS